MCADKPSLPCRRSSIYLPRDVRQGRPARFIRHRSHTVTQCSLQLHGSEHARPRPGLSPYLDASPVTRHCGVLDDSAWPARCADKALSASGATSTTSPSEFHVMIAVVIHDDQPGKHPSEESRNDYRWLGDRILASGRGTMRAGCGQTPRVSRKPNQLALSEIVHGCRRR